MKVLLGLEYVMMACLTASRILKVSAEPSSRLSELGSQNTGADISGSFPPSTMSKAFNIPQQIAETTILKGADGSRKLEILTEEEQQGLITSFYQLTKEKQKVECQNWRIGLAKVNEINDLPLRQYWEAKTKFCLKFCNYQAGFEAEFNFFPCYYTPLSTIN